jgi:hypothetical protein
MIGREEWRKAAHVFDGARIGVYTKNFVSLFEKIDKITAGTASRIKDSHPRCNPATEDLIKKVNVDLPELLAKKRHGYLTMVRDNANAKRFRAATVTERTKQEERTK